VAAEARLAQTAMLMLIDTPDPRYRPDPAPHEPRRRGPTPRVWLWLLGAGAAIVLAHFIPVGMIGFWLDIAAFWLLMGAAREQWMRDDPKSGPEP
jgi:anti-sigma factor RsiW